MRDEALTPQDREHLRLLSIGHYVVGGLSFVWGCFPIFHLVMGLGLLFGSSLAKPDERLPMIAVGGFFSTFAFVFILSGWLLAACLVVAGISLTQRARYTFCFVVAVAAAALCMPLGTVLGIFTIVVLLRPTVKAAFGVDGVAALPGG